MSQNTNKPSLKNAVELRACTKRYGERTIFDAIDFHVPAQKTTVLLGPSGTGKSTLLRLAIGLESPDAGDVIVFGENLKTLSRKELLALRKRYGMLFQDGALFGSLSVFDNIAFPLVHHTTMNAKERKARVEEVLSLVDLEGLGDRLPDQLSGGQRKRVGLARAISLKPEMVFFDEPTSGLDPQTSAAIDALINNMQSTLRMTFVVITHDVLSAKNIAHHVGVLMEGKVRVSGPREAVFASQDPKIRAFLDRKAPE